MNLLIKWLVSALALLVASIIIPGISVSSLGIALIVALILGFLNTLVRPILFIMTLPINILTLGLFTFVLNGLIFWFVASFVEGFEVSGFLTAIIGALFVSIFSWAINFILKESDRSRSQKNFYHVDRIEKPDDKENS